MTEMGHPVGYRHYLRKDQIPVNLIMTTFTMIEFNIIFLIKNTHMVILMHFIPIQMYFKVEFSFQHLNFTLTLSYFLVSRFSDGFGKLKIANNVFAPIMNPSIAGNSMNVID